MALSYSSNALSAKAKALYGNRIKKQTYHELLGLNSIADLSFYLKHHTTYQGVLQDVNEKTIHRRQLETLIRKDGYITSLRLLRYADQQKAAFYAFYVTSLEIQLLEDCLRILNSEDYRDFISDLPLFISPYLGIDLNKLGRVTSYEGLLEVVQKTPYYDILLKHKPKENETIRYANIEHDFQIYYFEKVLRDINKYYTGIAKKELLFLFETAIEVQNIATIYRYKKFFEVSPETIMDKLILVGKRISKAKWIEWVNASSAEELLQRLAQSNYVLYQDESKNIYIEYSMQQIRYKLAKHLMEFSNEPGVIFACFVILKEIEVNNVINVIEGVRYGASQDAISSLLIY